MRTGHLALLVAALLATAGCDAIGPSATPTAPPTQAAVTPDPTTDPSAAPSGSAPPTEPDCREPLPIGLITYAVGVEDGGAEQAAHAGILAAAEAWPGCFEVTVVTSARAADFTADVASLTEVDRGAVIGVGLALADALGEAAEDHPAMTFISIDGYPSTGFDRSWLENGVSLLWAEEQIGYLAGTLAAWMSDARHVGVVAGPVVIPPMERYGDGFAAGARAARPDIAVEAAYLESMADPAAATAATLAMAEAGVDVVFGVGQQTGQGALAAACQADLLAIGSEVDQFPLVEDARPCLLTSAIKDITAAVRETLRQVAVDEVVPGVALQDASTGGIRLTRFRDREGDVPAAVQARVTEALAGLADGSIVPDVTLDGS